MITASDILKASILIVDDLVANVSLLEQMLRGAGYVSIASTQDPATVCALHRQHRYDLILLDLQMPGLDGFQVMEGLKEIETGSYLPVLVITAQPDHKLRALKAGAKDLRPRGRRAARAPPRCARREARRVPVGRPLDHATDRGPHDARPTDRAERSAAAVRFGPRDRRTGHRG